MNIVYKRAKLIRVVLFSTKYRQTLPEKVKVKTFGSVILSLHKIEISKVKVNVRAPAVILFLPGLLQIVEGVAHSENKNSLNGFIF